MTTTKLAEYQNGNCIVKIFSDGTKIREFNGEYPWVEFPESIDLKITNRCRNSCTYCHESSCKQGEHAGPNNLFHLIYDSKLPRGVELAIGGGDPFEHPKLYDILSSLNDLGFICNMTINSKSIRRNRYAINHWLPELIHGLGISYVQYCGKEIRKILNENSVVHFIAGVDNVEDAINERFPKVLVLGFKHYGRAESMKYPKENIKKWKDNLYLLFNASQIMSFDNLALQQLNVKDHVSKKVWETHYMGDDGQFTMYIDAVKMQFAKSSTSPRIHIKNRTIKECMAVIK